MVLKCWKYKTADPWSFTAFHIDIAQKSHTFEAFKKISMELNVLDLVTF